MFKLKEKEPFVDISSFFLTTHRHKNSKTFSFELNQNYVGFGSEKDIGYKLNRFGVSNKYYYNPEIIDFSGFKYSARSLYGKFKKLEELKNKKKNEIESNENEEEEEEDLNEEKQQQKIEEENEGLTEKVNFQTEFYFSPIFENFKQGISFTQHIFEKKKDPSFKKKVSSLFPLIFSGYPVLEKNCLNSYFEINDIKFNFLPFEFNLIFRSNNQIKSKVDNLEQNLNLLNSTSTPTESKIGGVLPLPSPIKNQFSIGEIESTNYELILNKHIPIITYYDYDLFRISPTLKLESISKGFYQKPNFLSTSIGLEFFFFITLMPKICYDWAGKNWFFDIEHNIPELIIHYFKKFFGSKEE